MCPVGLESATVVVCDSAVSMKLSIFEKTSIVPPSLRVILSESKLALAMELVIDEEAFVAFAVGPD